MKAFDVIIHVIVRADERSYAIGYIDSALGGIMSWDELAGSANASLVAIQVNDSEVTEVEVDA